MTAAHPPRPVFLVSHARTGSTLLRYLLDAHPSLCCPPELALGRLCRDLLYTAALALGETRAVPDSPSAGTVAEARRHVDELMTACCVRHAKPRWCEKSTNNVEYLDALRTVFPDAQYICLHRNCLDVVESLLQLFRYGFTGRYAVLVSRSPSNVLDAMIDTWIEATERILALEAAQPEACLRVRYEDFVERPAASAERIFTFLGLPFDEGILSTMFTASHDQGPGDLKIQFTNAVLANRVGRGSRLPRGQISTDRFAQLNKLQTELGYAVLDPSPSPSERVLGGTGRVSRAVASGEWG
ncbi:MAG TPA: sulfotransferase [Vicinamibacterales bacterium]|nr:sulfotransferase [Vicinamibacterales bacterium]